MGLSQFSLLFDEFLCIGLCTKTGQSIFRDVRAVFYRHLPDKRAVYVPDLLFVPVQDWIRRLETRDCADQWSEYKACYILLQHVLAQ